MTLRVYLSRYGRADCPSLPAWQTYVRISGGVSACCSFSRLLTHSFIDAFISVSPFQASPLAHIQSQEFHNAVTYRLHDLLLAYNRLLIADPNIAKRNEWSLDTLHLLRSQHPDTGVRLLAIQALSRARQWSEQKWMEVELESIGKVDEVDCPVAFGWESIRDDTGVTFKRTIIDGWLFPAREAQRVDLCEPFC